MMILAIKQEETQWWITNVINLWNIVADVGFDSTFVEGCYSGEKLPLIEQLSEPGELPIFSSRVSNGII